MPFKRYRSRLDLWLKILQTLSTNPYLLAGEIERKNNITHHVGRIYVKFLEDNDLIVKSGITGDGYVTTPKGLQCMQLIERLNNTLNGTI